MYLTELYNERPAGYASEKDDNSVLKLSDLRKSSRITLADLNKIRMANDVRKVEHESKLEKVSKQYKPPAVMQPGIM